MNRSLKGDKLGAVCSIATGILYVLIILYVLAVPTGQRYDPGQFFENYARNPISMNVVWIAMAAISILAFAVIPSVSALVRTVSESWTQVACTVGLVGSAVSAVSFLTMLGRAPELAQAYVAGDSAAKAAIGSVGLPQLDPLNVLVLGGVGVWMLVINMLALHGGMLPKLQAFLGIGLAIFLGVAVLSAIVQSELLDQIAAGVGGVFAPIWYVWMGINLLKMKT
jgi:hypothetical protein